METYEITIVCANDVGKRHVFQTLEENLIHATRIVLTYKPKMKYHLEEIKIVRGQRLV